MFNRLRSEWSHIRFASKKEIAKQVVIVLVLSCVVMLLGMGVDTLIGSFIQTVL